jgi:hypothetical protein
LAPFLGERKGVFILERFYIVNIIVEDRQNAYRQVNELLHDNDSHPKKQPHS